MSSWKTFLDTQKPDPVTGHTFRNYGDAWWRAIGSLPGGGNAERDFLDYEAAMFTRYLNYLRTEPGYDPTVDTNEWELWLQESPGTRLLFYDWAVQQLNVPAGDNYDYVVKAVMNKLPSIFASVPNSESLFKDKIADLSYIDAIYQSAKLTLESGGKIQKWKEFIRPPNNPEFVQLASKMDAAMTPDQLTQLRALEGAAIGGVGQPWADLVVACLPNWSNYYNEIAKEWFDDSQISPGARLLFYHEAGATGDRKGSGNPKTFFASMADALPAGFTVMSHLLDDKCRLRFYAWLDSFTALSDAVFAKATGLAPVDSPKEESFVDIEATVTPAPTQTGTGTKTGAATGTPSGPGAGSLVPITSGNAPATQKAAMNAGAGSSGGIAILLLIIAAVFMMGAKHD